MEINGRKIRLGERTIIMGVVNVTPDSFSDGGRFFNPQNAVKHALKLARQGADWIDVGGESTRPGAAPVAEEEEMRRVLPVIQAIHRKMPSLPISIDTTKAAVAEEAVRAGAAILNDVSGLRADPKLAEVASRHNTPLILMHMRGSPATMQRTPFARSVWVSVRNGLKWSIGAAERAGVRRSQLIIDPGLGFGKSRRQNFEVLAHLDRLRRFCLPIIVGTSRKSFIQAIVAGERLDSKSSRQKRSCAAHPSVKNYWVMMLAQSDARLPGAAINPGSRETEMKEEWKDISALNLGDAAAISASILSGAHIVRVHDVEAMMPAARIADAVLECLR